MKKLLIFTFALLLCLMATSALAAETTYTGTISPIIVDTAGEHTIVLNGVTINAYLKSAINVKSPATKLTIVLKDGTTNTLTASDNYAVIANNGVDLLIRCESAGEGHVCDANCGTLTVFGGYGAVGIGGYNMSGTITIAGGIVEAYGEYAGIGGRNMRGAIIISGGKVTPDGEHGGTLIGGSNEFSGTITITGSNVIAQAEVENYGGIGGGVMSGTITITDSTVSAGSYLGSGIGSGGNREMSGTITIVNSTISVSSDEGAGIGSGAGGKMSESGTITITDSTIRMLSMYGAGIGSGNNGEMSGTITITDSTVTAESRNSAGIGAGYGGDFTGKLIMRGNVDVTAIGDPWGIGPGHDGPIGEGAEIYVEPTNSNVIGVKQGRNEASAVNLAGTPYSVKTDLIPLLNGSRYVRTRYNAETVTPSPSPKPVTPSPKPVTPSPKPVTPSPKPVTPSPVPVTPSPKPVTPSPVPVTPSPKPVTPSPVPVTPSPKPVTPSPKPVTPTSCYGGTATCVNLAICEDCGKGYGELNKNNHVHKVILPYVPPTTTSTGLTEGLKCGDCQTIIIPQQIIPMLPSNLPQTGDSTNFVLLAALAVIGMIGMTVIIRKKNEA